jgi:hypothetical protein
VFAFYYRSNKGVSRSDGFQKVEAALTLRASAPYRSVQCRTLRLADGWTVIEHTPGQVRFYLRSNAPRQSALEDYACIKGILPLADQDAGLVLRGHRVCETANDCKQPSTDGGVSDCRAHLCEDEG